MELVLLALLPYLINLAAAERTSAISARREQELRAILAKETTLKTALASRHSLRQEVHSACIALAKNRVVLGVTEEEVPLWNLLSDEAFQADLATWLMAGAIEEGEQAKERLSQSMESALARAGRNPERIDFLRNGYFDLIERLVYSNPILAAWRHQLSLIYLRNQVIELRRRAEEAAGQYSDERQDKAITQYCMKALAAWDIIDLSNLPEGDVHIVTQKLLLRQLYMPLRVVIEGPHQRKDKAEEDVPRVDRARDAHQHGDSPHAMKPQVQAAARKANAARLSLGACLDQSRRLVVLGDPGGGKTTVLRWLATALLLRNMGDPAFTQMPDTSNVPADLGIPVLIRCRDLGDADLCRSFVDFLTQHLLKSELLPDEASVMRAVILDRIAKGEAVLLIDGLDEITDLRVRMMFCQELERTAVRYPEATIIATSRIVGYRDMPYRMGSDFAHYRIAELDQEDKDLFAQRWIEVTEQHQPLAEQKRRAKELLDALHSSDRISRLTGNPMLLTTLALVKRKVGKLPNRRNKLYAEAVSVLLNWNPRLYQAIDEEEAIPQLEYLAFEMCRRGVQRLPGQDVLDLLERLREEYPNIRAVRRRPAHDFLELLEARSSIVIRSGSIWDQGSGGERPLWEFRHLTFQEYLAARALIDGRFPERDKSKSLAEQVAPLAGSVGKVSPADSSGEVLEAWRETIRLLVADCNDDDVDDVVLAILRPPAQEDREATARARAALATLCLADEPNISESTVKEVFAEFASLIAESDGDGYVSSQLDRAAAGAAASMWCPLLKLAVITRYSDGPNERLRLRAGSLWGTTDVEQRLRGGNKHSAFRELVEAIGSTDRRDRLASTLAIMVGLFRGYFDPREAPVEMLLDQLEDTDPAMRHSAAWALGWAARGAPFRNLKEGLHWTATPDQVARVIAVLEGVDANENDAVAWLAIVCEHAPDHRAIGALLRHINSDRASVRRTIVRAIGKIGDKRARPGVEELLQDKDEAVRVAALEALGNLGDEQGALKIVDLIEGGSDEQRRAAFGAIVKLGGTAIVARLRVMVESENEKLAVGAAAALTLLGDQIGRGVLRTKLESESSDLRVSRLEVYAKLATEDDRLLLSTDFDGAAPWLDPGVVIDDSRLAVASEFLGESVEEVRARYDEIAERLPLKLGWKGDGAAH